MNSYDQKILNEIEQAAKKFNNYLVNHLNRKKPNNHSNIADYQKNIFDELKKQFPITHGALSIKLLH